MSNKRKAGQQKRRAFAIRLVAADDAVLRSVAQYADPSAQTAALAQRLVQTAVRERGYAVAAPQVGSNVRLIGMHTDRELVGRALAGRGVLNPEIVDLSSETETRAEGCLTFPGRWWSVARAKRVTVTALDPGSGAPLAFDVVDPMLSRMWQHEVDHLDGLMLDDGRYEDITAFVESR